MTSNNHVGFSFNYGFPIDLLVGEAGEVRFDALVDCKFEGHPAGDCAGVVELPVDIIDSCFAGIYEESVAGLRDHPEALGEDEVKVVVLIEQRRYHSTLKQVENAYIEVLPLRDGAGRTLDLDFIGLDYFEFEDPFSTAVGSAVLDGNEASAQTVEVDLHCGGQLYTGD